LDSQPANRTRHRGSAGRNGEFNGKQTGNIKVSLADLIVLGGCAAVEKAASDAGVQVSVPFTPGRRDTTQELTDIKMFDWLKPVVDGFRNYVDDQFAEIAQGVSPEEMFLDKAQLLALTAPEWVALVGGLRAMGANYDGSANGIFTDRVGVLTNDFFTVLTSMDYEWKKEDETDMVFSLNDRATGETRFKATRSDLIFRLQQPTSCRCRGVREQRRTRPVRERLRAGLGQGHDA
jgi:catalase-peroxidase